MKIQNEFAKLIKNGSKTIEIRKTKSFKQLQESLSKHDNGIGLLEMSVIDYPHNDCSKIYDIYITCCGKFAVVFNGYQKIKVSDLFDMIKPFEDWSTEELNEYENMDCEFIDVEEWNETPIWLRENLSWLLEWKETGEWYDEANKIPKVSHKNYDFVYEYLKNEEYCIIYFIDMEKTKQINGWS